MRRTVLVWVCLLLFSGCSRSGGMQTLEVLSSPAEIKQEYTSMTGPAEDRDLRLGEGPPELLWVVGYEAEVLNGEGAPTSKEFMCHASLDTSPSRYRGRIGSRLPVSGRLFTLSQGMQNVRFPEGFGLPVLSDELVTLRTQVLNLNGVDAAEVRYRVRINYYRDRDLKEPMKALFLVRAPALKAVGPEARHFGPEVVGAGCSVGSNANPEGYLEYDSQGQAFIPHWRVAPGREINKTLITERLSLPQDLRVHYIAAHMHPTAESLELVDLTSMESVFRSQVEGTSQGLGIERIGHFASVEGLLLKKGHHYGLVSTYNNDSGRELDSMAVMYLYLHDPGFVPPSALELELPLVPGAEVIERAPELTRYQVKSPRSFVQAYYSSALKEPWKASDSNSWLHPEATLKLEGEGGLTRVILRLR